MVRDNWNPLRLFGCLSARNKGYSRLCGKTLGGRIGKKGTRPIPKAFVDRFMECYAVSDLPDAPVKKAVIDYYTKELANGDYDFDPSKAEYPGIFKQQLEAVKVKNLKASESRQGISHDNQWHVIETLGKGSYGVIYLLEWYPFGTMGCLYSSFMTCAFGFALRVFIRSFILTIYF